MLGGVEMLNVKSFNHTLLPGCTDPVLVHFQEKYWNHALVFLILEGGPSKWLGGLEMLNVKSFNQTLLPRCTYPVLVHFWEKYWKHALVFLI